MKELWRTWHEFGLLAALLTACLVLAFLQYRWTGELSRAEAARLSASAQGRLQDMARAFDAELRREVLALVPSGDAVKQSGAERANADLLRRALADPQRRPAFRRIAAAVRDGAHRDGARRDGSARLRYFEARENEARFVAAPWPDEKGWQVLRERLEQVASGGRPHAPMLDPASALIEVPVFAGDAEAEWMLFELDTEYVAKDWLPRLARTYLNSEAEDVFSVGVAWDEDPARWVWREPAGVVIRPADAETAMFPLRYLGPGRGRDTGRWRLAARHRLGSVPEAVAAAYRRNLAVGLLPLGLVMAAGIALLRNTRQAQRLAAAQFQFFAGISHELRTPLTVIQGAGHNLLSGVVRDEAQRENYLRAIVKQTGQLAEMVEQVLAYGAVRSQQAVGRAAVDVAISEAIETAAMDLEQSGRSVDVDMPPDLPAVQSDAAGLHRVFSNIILNAIRHGAGEVRVTGMRDGSMVEVRIADSGPGIPAPEMKRVFEPFFRGDKARSGRTRGTGLGLSLVKETVERAGGNVTVESSPENGTVFVVRLAVAA